MNILPNRLLQVVGEHEDFPVENLSKSRCGHFLASCSHDQKVKFWNIQDIPKIEVDANKKSKKSKNKRLTAVQKKDDFFADMMDGDTSKGGVSGDESSDDENADSSDDESGIVVKRMENKNEEDSDMKNEPDDESEDSDNNLNLQRNEDSESSNSDSGNKMEKKIDNKIV